MSIITEDSFTGCLICGQELTYAMPQKELVCAMCGKAVLADIACRAGHFVCDDCHNSGATAIFAFLSASIEKNPLRLLERLFNMDAVHMHGPEHHIIIPALLVTAYHNNGGKIDYKQALAWAAKRGRQLPGGICGFWGACGAAIGAGIYAAIVMSSHPLNKQNWPIPQQLCADTLAEIALLGGPRCCKRTSFIAISQSIKFTREKLGINMPEDTIVCHFSAVNKECLYDNCPYYLGE